MKLSQFGILIIVIVIAWASLFITAINQGQQIQSIVKDHTSTINTVERNQQTNSTAIKEYIACLISINPSSNLQVQEQTCFNAAPGVK